MIKVIFSLSIIKKYRGGDEDEISIISFCNLSTIIAMIGEGLQILCDAVQDD